MNTHYKTLGLQEGASQQEVQEAYDRLSKDLDPANNDNQEFFKEEYKKVQEAYKALHNSSILATEKGAKQLVKKPTSTSKKKSDSAKPIKEKLDTPKKKNIKSNILLFFIAIGIWGLLLQNAGFFDYVQKEYQRAYMTPFQRLAEDLKELSEPELVQLMKYLGAWSSEMKFNNEAKQIYILKRIKELYRFFGLQENASQKEIQEAYERLSTELNLDNNENKANNKLLRTYELLFTKPLKRYYEFDYEFDYGRYKKYIK
jgi:curved DNA-binding protein CbpA